MADAGAGADRRPLGVTPNHSGFKFLFFGAGAVLNATGELATWNDLGGLILNIACR